MLRLEGDMEQCKGKGEVDLKKGPWTVDEDLLLMNYVSVHGEGRWDSVARCAGLRRTGKSCRLRWLNYLRPDVRRGNITPEEQLLILQLHSRWGSRWSKIAQHLPGRTDNEIKNYWRTRVQKHAKQLRCDVNSKQFRDMIEYIWVPRLLERIQGGEAAAVTAGAESPNTGASSLECCYSSEVAQPSSSASDAAQGGEEVGLGDWLVDQETAAEFSDSLMESLRSPGVCDGSWLQDMDQLGGAWEESLWSIDDLWLQQGL